MWLPLYGYLYLQNSYLSWQLFWKWDRFNWRFRVCLGIAVGGGFDVKSNASFPERAYGIPVAPIPFPSLKTNSTLSSDQRGGSLSPWSTVRPQTAPGFALIVTLLLMILLTVIAVGLLSLASISLRTSSTSTARAEAQANARLALMLAIGQLQKAAGQDQRVTARAEILDASATILTNTTVKQPLWTGVWKTHNPANPTWNLDVDATGSGGNYLRDWSTVGSATATTREKNPNMDWLVSGATDPTTNATINPVDWVATSSNSVALAKTTLAAGGFLNTSAPLVDVKNSSTGLRTGKYAYWISDEGVKAKVNLKDPTLGISSADLARNALHFSAPQATAGHKILPSGLSTEFRNLSSLPNAVTPSSMGLVATPNPFAAAATPLSSYLPDITTYSYGVLADVKNGGLKKDLTAAFEDNGVSSGKNWAKLNADGFTNIYDLTTDAIPVKPNSGLDYYVLNPKFNTGVKWNSLYYFYNTYKSVMPTGSSTSLPAPTSPGSNPAGIGNPASLPFTVGARIESWKSSENTVNPAGNGAIAAWGTLMPVPVAYQWNVALERVPNGADWRLNVRYYPQLTLYNPYSAAITASNFSYRKFMSLDAAEMYCRIAITPPPPAPQTAVCYYVQLNQSRNGYRPGVLTKPEANFRMEPGEIRVFGMDQDYSISGAPIEGTVRTPNSMTQACEYLGGLVSNNMSPDKAVSTPLLKIKTLDTNSTRTATSTFLGFVDTYDIFPVVTAGSTIQINLTKRPGSPNDPALNTDGYNSVGRTLNALLKTPVAQSLAWPNEYKYNNLQGFYSDTDNSLIHAGAIGVGKMPSTGTVLAPTPIESMPQRQSLYLMQLRRKGLKSDNLLASATTGYVNSRAADAHMPVNHGNDTSFNLFAEIRQSGQKTLERYFNSNTYPAYSNLPGITGSNPDGTTTTGWGNYSATSVSAPIPASPTRTVLSDVPMQPLTSLGQLMHAKPYYYFNDTGLNGFQPFGSMFIGGSLPNPVLPTNITYKWGIFFGYSDSSYLANQALFDTYFLSTVPPSSKPGGTTWPVNWTEFNSANSGATLTDATKPLLNTRIVPNPVEGTIQLSDLRDMDKAAANLMLNGAFNINSTSVAAWKALLYSLSGNDFNIYDATNRTTKTFSGLNCPIPRFLSATSNGNVNQPWCAVRDLTDAQVTDLATKIVSEVKARGPFLSMADFLNRRLDASSTDRSRAGALQAAIDKTSPDINSTAKAAGEPMVSPTEEPWLTTKDANTSAGASYNTALGIPGYLMQQDLVQAFSPAMTARSDTFVIRAYGESTPPTMGAAVAKAYCEAVVQRMPELMDNSQPAETATASLSSVNPLFGRRFRIISFRWLNPDEI